MITKTVRNGYSTVRMTYDRALREMPHAQCGVKFTADGSIHFYSYVSTMPLCAGINLIVIYARLSNNRRQQKR